MERELALGRLCVSFSISFSFQFSCLLWRRWWEGGGGCCGTCPSAVLSPLTCQGLERRHGSVVTPYEGTASVSPRECWAWADDTGMSDVWEGRRQTAALASRRGIIAVRRRVQLENRGD